jgi:hypothetical protein
MISSQHAYNGVDLVSGALPSGRLWYAEPNAVNNVIGYALRIAPESFLLADRQVMRP